MWSIQTPTHSVKKYNYTKDIYNWIILNKNDNQQLIYVKDSNVLILQPIINTIIINYKKDFILYSDTHSSILNNNCLIILAWLMCQTLTATNKDNIRHRHNSLHWIQQIRQSHQIIWSAATMSVDICVCHIT